MDMLPAHIALGSHEAIMSENGSPKYQTLRVAVVSQSFAAGDYEYCLKYHLQVKLLGYADASSCSSILGSPLDDLQP